MAIPIYADMVTPHYAEWLVEQDPAFRGTVLMAVKAVARQVLDEDVATHGHTNRKQIAENIVRSPTEAERLLPLFLAAVIQDESLRPQAFDVVPGAKSMQDRIQPWKMETADLQEAVASVWNIAANVQPEPPPTEPIVEPPTEP